MNTMNTNADRYPVNQTIYCRRVHTKKPQKLLVSHGLDTGSEIRDPEKTYHGFRIRIKRSKRTGSRIRNTGVLTL